MTVLFNVYALNVSFLFKKDNRQDKKNTSVFIKPECYAEIKEDRRQFFSKKCLILLHAQQPWTLKLQVLSSDRYNLFYTR